MATKAKENETPEIQETQNPETQNPETQLSGTSETQAKDPYRKVKIKIPREKNKPGVYVNVNTHSFYIPRGEVVEVPAYIAEVLENSAKQDESTALLIERLTKDSDY